MILTAVLCRSILCSPIPKCSTSQRFQGQQPKQERAQKQKKQQGINLRPFDKQPILSPESVSKAQGPGGKMIHDPRNDNSTDSWPVRYMFHSTCSFNVSSTIKQRPILSCSFFFSPVARRRFLALMLEHLLPTNNSPHVCDAVT